MPEVTSIPEPTVLPSVVPGTAPSVPAASTTVRADTITVVGVDSNQFSTATVVCEFNSQTNTFTFTITNTSAITQPGSTSTITGVGPTFSSATTTQFGDFESYSSRPRRSSVRSVRPRR